MLRPQNLTAEAQRHRVQNPAKAPQLRPHPTLRSLDATISQPAYLCAPLRLCASAVQVIKDRRRCSERLNDLLISGKSGTMLPITACSSTGQFCHDGSCACTRRSVPSAPGLQRDQHLAAPALHPADADGCPSGGVGNRLATSPSGKRSRILRHSSSDSSTSSKRTVTRAATSPLRCVGHVHVRADRRARSGTARADPRPSPLARPASPLSPSCVGKLRRTRPVPMKRSCRPGCSSKMHLDARDLRRAASRSGRAAPARPPAPGRTPPRRARSHPSDSDGRTAPR